MIDAFFFDVDWHPEAKEHTERASESDGEVEVWVENLELSRMRVFEDELVGEDTVDSNCESLEDWAGKWKINVTSAEDEDVQILEDQQEGNQEICQIAYDKEVSFGEFRSKKR
jgi:hypothetical protein